MISIASSLRFMDPTCRVNVYDEGSKNYKWKKSQITSFWCMAHKNCNRLHEPELIMASEIMMAS